MGYRLEISKIKYNTSGGKLYGYTETDNLKSFKYLYNKGYVDEDAYWSYGFNPQIVLTANEFKEFIKLYIKDLKDYYNYSEEEKKAIEYFKRRIANKKTDYTSIYFKIEKLELILNLIDKQQKEIDHLNLCLDSEDKAKASLERDIKSLLHIEPNDNFIHKDKIREILNNTEKNKEEDRPSIVLENLILNIKELLGEEDE